MDTYLVTGAAGFIGSNLVETLLNSGQKVIAFDNFSQGKKTNLDFVDTLDEKENFSLIEGDIRDLDACHKACQNVTYVLHQAALGSVPRSLKEPILFAENNILGTLNMLVAARDAKVQRFVFASSSAVYGDTEVLPKVETMPSSPKSPYAVSKVTGEYYCKIFYEQFNLPTIALRYFNVFGPKQDPESQYAAVIPKFVTSILQNQSPTIYGDGEQTRDFTYIENVVNANIQSCKAPKEAFGKALNIGCGYRISINQLVNAINKTTETNIQSDYKEERAGDVKDSLADIASAKNYLKLNNMVSLEDGLEKTIQWYKRNLA